MTDATQLRDLADAIEQAEADERDEARAAEQQAANDAAVKRMALGYPFVHGGRPANEYELARAERLAAKVEACHDELVRDPSSTPGEAQERRWAVDDAYRQFVALQAECILPEHQVVRVRRLVVECQGGAPLTA